VKLIHKLEPLWWILFGSGGFVIGFVLPALILGVLLLGSSSLMADGLEYHRALRLASSPIGKLFLIVAPTLGFWHCAHHMRHFALDVGGHGAAAPGAFLSYGLALAATIATVAAVLAL
jgi:fumarate reductase subunit D